MKIGIIQTGSLGDNINSTLMLPPLRAKYLDADITVHTSSLYESAFWNNPYINQLRVHQASNKKQALALMHEVRPLIDDCDIQLMPHPAVNPGKWASSSHPEAGENLIYAWVRALEEIGVPYPWPPCTTLQLSPAEVDRVDQLCKRVPGFNGQKKTLMEMAGESGQSFYSRNWTMAIVPMMCARGEIVFASRRYEGIDTKQLKQRFPRQFFFVGDLSVRECSELYNRCDRFLSVSSGLANACNTSGRRRDVEWIEVVNSAACSTAPIYSQGRTYWHENDLNKFKEFFASRL
jgi:hypothetical protein